MAKSKGPKTVYVCQICGAQQPRWMGKCPDCGEWNSLVEEKTAPSRTDASPRGGLFRLREVAPVAYHEIESQDDARQSSGIEEFDRVLGGGIVPGSLVLIGGEPGIGKCVVGDTRIIDPETGEFLPIVAWEHKDRSVLSLESATQRISTQKVDAFCNQGVRPVVEVTTRLGRTLRCTPTHPLLTPDGWQPVGDLPPGTRIAAPRSLPYFGKDAMAESEVKLIAYILSDGSAQSSINVTAALPEIEADLRHIARHFDMQLRVYNKPNNRAKQYRFVQPVGQRAQTRKVMAAALKQARAESGMTWAKWARAAGVDSGMLYLWAGGECSPSATELESLAEAAGLPLTSLSPEARDRSEMTTSVARFLQSVGLRFKRAENKSVPGCVFRLPRPQLALFLKVLFSCDGSVYVNKKGQPGVSYSTISKRLAEDVQHLLLRFGFITRLRTKRSQVNGQLYIAYEIQLLGIPEVNRFLSEIGILGREDAKARIASLTLPTTASTQHDTIPTGFGFWTHLREVTGGDSFSEISAKAGVFIRDRRHERPLCRKTVIAIADAYPSDRLRALAYGDVYWDEIQSVVPAGEENVYDLSVPAYENFVANDLILHNSTLLLEVSDKLTRNYGKVLYISGEESERQIKLRGERLGINPQGLYLLPETCLERIFEEIDRLDPQAVVVDSVQTVFSMKLESAPGSVSQVREVAGQFLILAKNRSVPVFLIGHVTKEGTIAGPKALEHIVDTVLYFEGERHHNHRIIRAVKNRFGAANELGVFEMTATGLVPVLNPSGLFLNERPVGVSGSIVTACMEGTRPLLVELQALVTSNRYGTSRRMTQGVDTNRVALLMAMLEKRVGMSILSEDVFVNVAGGMTIDEPAADLGIVVAIASSFRNIPVDERAAVFGEVGLAGEVRATSQASVRVREAYAMGFRRCVIPHGNMVGLEYDDGIEVIGVRNVADALEALF
ncbi:MAG TPA: DNA repair protein RadA [Blastocatellia bacterium]|nr:DNA repair protein RadA [Blastocatellia bacterium]